MTVAMLRRHMTAREFKGWVAYFEERHAAEASPSPSVPMSMPPPKGQGFSVDLTTPQGIARLAGAFGSD